jgi:hypothetical protein
MVLPPVAAMHFYALYSRSLNSKPVAHYTGCFARRLPLPVIDGETSIHENSTLTLFNMNTDKVIYYNRNTGWY